MHDPDTLSDFITDLNKWHSDHEKLNKELNEAWRHYTKARDLNPATANEYLKKVDELAVKINTRVLTHPELRVF